jgi:hypothetical protein
VLISGFDSKGTRQRAVPALKVKPDEVDALHVAEKQTRHYAIRMLALAL